MNIVDVALKVGAAFDEIGVGYFVGGSVASSLQGEARSTQDLDVVADLPPKRVADWASALGPDFDVDEEALFEAMAKRRPWNVFFSPTAIKVDVFRLAVSNFDRSEFERRRRIAVRPGAELSIKSPEDSVLRKLWWFRQGGEVSQNQWRDVLAVLRVSEAVIDGSYLDRFAPELGITDLLARARVAAELPKLD